MKFTANDGVLYRVHTAGEGRPLVGLHGFTGTGRGLLQYFPLLTTARRMIAPDLLGHGDTDAPDAPARYQIERAAADIAALIDTHADGRADVFGYSMGGRLALYLALTYPSRVRSLILESASPGLEMDDERTARIYSDDGLAARIERDGVAAFVEDWERLSLFASQSDARRAALRPERLAQRPNGLANSLRGMGTGMQPSLWDQLQQLSMPVLLITGALDTKFRAIAAQMVAQMPHAQHIVIPDAGHAPHLEQNSVFQSALAAFLQIIH
ncbi:MAG: 2-succinyl-6-hydroxy-2,4-cyclohexadiene-1-carboxylate synthase [Chloroflexota bacterium]|nr:2-succinyl-6-hydroxy-2,4-cyclohexadiene-1-carboxylate synthase [Chloroflexota bacterium]